MTRSLMQRYWSTVEKIHKQEKSGKSSFELMNRGLIAAKVAVLEKMRREGLPQSEIEAAAQILKHAKYGRTAKGEPQRPVTKMGEFLNTAMDIRERHGEETLRRVAEAISRHAEAILNETREKKLAAHPVANPLVHLHTEVGKTIIEFLDPQYTEFFRDDIREESLSKEVEERLMRFLEARQLDFGKKKLEVKRH